MVTTIIKAVQKLFNSEGFNDAVKKAEDARDLSIKVFEWAIPALAALIVAKIAEAESRGTAVEKS